MERSNQSARDKALLDGFVREGREESFNALVQHYKLRLFNAAFRVLNDEHAAEDVVQKAFIKLLERRNELTEVRSLQSWLYKMALNLSLDMKKSMRRRKDREKAEKASSSPETPREAAFRGEVRKELELALAKLKDSLRIPLILRYLHGLTYAEASEIMSLSEYATRKRVNRGLTALRKLLVGRGLLVPVVAVEAGLQSIPAKAASAHFLTSASSIIQGAATAAVAAKAATTTTSIVRGVLIMTTKGKIAMGATAAILAGFLFLCLRGRLTDKGDARPGPPAVARRGSQAGRDVPALPSGPTDTEKLTAIARGKGMAIIASSEMVERRAVDFRNVVDAVWDAKLGTVFASGDGVNTVRVPAGLEVNTVKKALSRCQTCMLLWDENIHQRIMQSLKQYCQTGGWLVFVSCPWTGSSPKSSPAELLRLRDFQGVADVRGLTGYAERPGAVAVLKHPSLPDLPLGEQVRLNRPSFKALTGGENGSIPLVRFENPSLRGVTIQAVGHGGIVQLNWDCAAGGRIGDADGLDFLKRALRWLAARESWKEPISQPGLVVSIIARTPAGEPAPGTQIALNVYTDWARPVSQKLLTVDDNGECQIPATAPAIWAAGARGERYASDTLALERLEEGKTPDPLVVNVRPILRIVGTVVYASEEKEPAAGVEVDLLPSSRAREMEPFSCMTDEEGRFSFEPVPGGRSYLVRCETEEWGAVAEVDLPGSAESGTFEVALSLKKLVAIDGKVVEEGEGGKPIEGATVLVRPSWGIKGVDLFLQHLSKRVVSAESDGAFRIPVVPDLSYGVKAEAPGYVWPWIELGLGRYERWVEVEPPATVTLELRRGMTVKGIVYLPGGQPAPGALVWLLAGHMQLSDSSRIRRTDMDGTFCFPCTQFEHNGDGKVKYVGVGAYSVRFAGYKREPIPAEQNEIELVVHLEEKPLIQGEVTDLQGRPLANAAIYSPWETHLPPYDYSDENGLFESRVSGQLWVVREGYASKLVEHDELEAVARENTLLRVALPRAGGRVAGRVVLHDGTPLRNEMVGMMVRNEAIRRLLEWQHNIMLGDGGVLGVGEKGR